MKKMDEMLSLTAAWFRKTGAALPWRENRDPYRVWISEIMLQQTRIETVIPYYLRFMKEAPDVFALAALSEEKLFKLWEGLGYYTRARNLKKCAEILCREYNGSFPRTAKELALLPGIGAYTAGAVASIAFGEKAPAVDGNVLRVVTRCFAMKDDIAKPQTREKITSLLAARYPEGDEAGEVTQGLMEIGEKCCIPNGAPLCASCPLKTICASKDGLWETIPVKTPKKERRIEEKTVFLLQCGEKFALEKRGESGLLAGLFGFPTVDGALTEKEARDRLSSLGFQISSLAPCGEAKHIFTHVEWRMKGLCVLVQNEKEGFFWASPQEILHQYALPSAFRAFRKMIGK